MQQTEMFHETIEDALIAIVQGSGGYKAVGHALWPEKGIEDAGRYLRHCLTTGREREKLSLDQLLWLLARGKEHGIHTGMYYLCDALGYTRPEPVTEEDQRAELQRQVVEVGKTLEGLLKRLDGHDRVRAVR